MCPRKEYSSLTNLIMDIIICISNECYSYQCTKFSYRGTICTFLEFSNFIIKYFCYGCCGFFKGENNTFDDHLLI